MQTTATSPLSSRAAGAASKLRAGRPIRHGATIRRALHGDIAWLATCALLIAVGLQLAALAVARYIEPRPATAAPSASIELAGDELLYRACVREARLKSLPVQPYPQASQRMSFHHEGKLLLKQTETLETDVTDMSVDNGCQVTLQRRLHTEAAPSSTFAAGVRRMAMARPADPARPMAPAPEAADASSCKPQRDIARHSPYLLLSLCFVERAPRPGAAIEPKRKTRGARRPST